VSLHSEAIVGHPPTTASRPHVEGTASASVAAMRAGLQTAVPLLRFGAVRLVMSVPVFFSVVTLIFVIVRVLPGDPAQAALGDYASPDAVHALRARLGLDDPLPIQYVRFLADLARGDFGTSMINGAPVRDQIAYNLPYTLQLTVFALLIGIAAGVPTGVLTAVQRNRVSDYVGRTLSLVGLSAPAFFLGILLMLVFAVRLRWLPATGGDDLVLPAITLGLVMTASITRLTRAALLGVLPHEYVRTARAKGLSATSVVFSHALRPALLPIVSLTGVWVVALIGDSVTTEVVFSRPGLGKMLVGAMLQRDYTLLQSVMVVFTAFVVGVNLLTEIVYGCVDPRVRA
jgi:peptide/nickel transport system permease protein